MIVTREFLRDWKASDRIAIHHDETGRYDASVCGVIRFIREGKSRQLADETETVFTLPSAMRRDYESTRDPERVFHIGFAMLYNWKSQDFSVTRGLAHALRVGDEITLAWMPYGAQNQYMTDARLCGDMLRLHVKRGAQTFALELDRQACADNSARMCRSQVYGGY